MVRAAVTGAFNYTGSDPTNKHWRLRHRLVISGLMAQDDKELLQDVHRHWLGYLAHGNLTTDSFGKVKDFATNILKDIKKATYPWREDENQEEKNATISKEEADLISRYKAKRAQFIADTSGN